MSNTINQAVVAHLDESGKTLKAAEALIAGVMADSEKVAAAIPSVVGQLVETGLLKQAEADRAVTTLASHEGALQVIQNLVQKMAADHRETQQKQAAAGNGSSVSATSLNLASTKTAEVDRSAGGFLGRPRSQGQKTAADLAFEKTLFGEN